MLLYRILPEMQSDNFSNEEIKKWGYLHKLQKERLKDDLLKKSACKDPKKIQQIKADWCKTHGLQNDEDLSKWLKEHNHSNSEWLNLLIRNWCWENWCKIEFKSKIPSYYLKRKSSLDQVIYSLVRVKNKQLANELYLRIKEGEDPFWKVAKEYSEGLERNTEGRVGPVPINRAHPQLSRMLQASQEGQLWPPKKLGDWWIIIRLEKSQVIKLNKEISNQLSLELGELHLEEILKFQSSPLHNSN
tara:strand:+ start:766 stop:1500 length:735 start_codon:yes stop_codon:yes gene_type:complete